MDEEEKDTSEDTSDEEESSETEESEEETVSLKKAEHEKLLSDLDNYKKATLVAKGKSDKKTPSLSGVMTKEDFYKANEKEAFDLAIVTSPDDTPEVLERKAEIKEHWSEIVGYYVDKHGRDTARSALRNINIAHAAWRADQETVVKKDVASEKTASAEIAKSAGKGGSTPPPAPPPRRKILTQNIGGMKGWYQ